MARLPRFVLPGYPQHVIQRGNNRQPILVDEEDYWFLWAKLKDAALKFRCDVHSYVLMPNHFHLILTPWSEDGIGKLMQYTGRYYVQHVNARYGRTGTLWEGRYRATLFDPAAHMIEASRYVELNPVRAGLVRSQEDYDWSSYGANAHGADDELVHPHGAYKQLGRSVKARRDAYRESFETPLSDTFVQRLRDATNKAWVLGDESFCRHIEGKLNRRASPRPRGGDRRSEAYRKAAAKRAERGAQSSPSG
ncbi:MAG: transposase [Thiohalocapsa sp.]|nr:transposase [Thiohalocapsa sp.]